MRAESQVITNAALRQLASFPIGFAVDPVNTKANLPYRRTLIAQGASITATNSMKPSRISPRKGVFDFGQADYLADFAHKQNLRLHGHTLVWYTDTAPGWLKQIRDSTELEDALKKYIQTVGNHFKGKVASWDVVNEAFNNSDGAIRKGYADEEGKSLLNLGGILGNDYVGRMFQYAHQADRTALLFYNEYGQESNAKKMDAILKMVQDFKRKSIPIHGLGLQMHININTADAGIENALQKSADTGLMVHISELDISMNTDKTKEFVPSREQLEKQYRKYKFVVSTYKRVVPVKQQFGITMWGIGDADSWIPAHCQCTDFPLLYDEKYIAKKAFNGFIEGLK